MTPQERQLVAELFDRLATLENAPRDPDAEAMIRDGLRQAPNAAYALVQTVLVQDEALKAANARIQEYEQSTGSAAAAQRAAGGFLDNMRDSCVRPRGAARLGAACAARRGADGRAGADPWGRGGQGGYQQGGYQQGGYQPAVATSRARRCRRRLSPRWRRRLVPRHRGGRRGRHDRRLAADGRHPVRDGRRSSGGSPASGAFDSRPAAAGARRAAAMRRAAISRARPGSTTSAAAPAPAAARSAPGCSTASRTTAKAIPTSTTAPTTVTSLRRRRRPIRSERLTHAPNQNKRPPSPRRPSCIRCASASDHHDLGADLHAAVEIDHVLVAHADAARRDRVPMVQGSFEPWMR